MNQKKPPKQNQCSESVDPMRVLINLLKLLMSKSVDSASLIQYIEHFHIDPNTYLPSMNGDLQIPLIYYCCSNPNLTDFFIYLVDKQVNLTSLMICEDDPDQQIELLYYSQIQYIPTLIERGCRLDPNKISINAEKLLIKGNITKLITLYKHGAISKDHLLMITQKPGLIFRVLDHLYERVYLLCQQISDETKLKEVISEIMKNYINAFKLFFKNGVSTNQMENGETFLQRTLNTYFTDIIKLVIDYQPNFDHVEFLHYSNCELTNRQVMKIFYNDTNYVDIQNLLKDKIVPQKIIVKKPITKKKIIT
jgi:hypothetical protein